MPVVALPRRWLSLPVSSALALALLSGCSPAPEPAAPVAAAPSAAEAEGPSCPYDAFDVFLRHFGREIALQESATADPLRNVYYDVSGEGDPRQVSEDIVLPDVSWPVMPDPSSLERNGRQMQVHALPDGRMEVLMLTPDTSDQQRYRFAQSPCWRLEERVDESI